MTESKNEEKNEKKTSSRRNFLKYALITTGAVAGFLGTVRFDAQDGIKVGKSSVSGGMADAQAACGIGQGCSGGGGQCGIGQGCGGGGGTCGIGQGCSGH